MMDEFTRSRHSVVCVVDDDAAVCRALAFALDLEGFAVETFDSGEALLLRDSLTPISCIVMDERLPGVSGLAALAQLRARGVSTPALLITSHPNPSLRKAAASVGAPILEKPLLGETLVDAIRTAVAAGG